MSSFRETNDPRESGPWCFDIGSNSQNRLDQTSLSSADLLSDALKDHARVLCFCTDTAPLTGDHLHDVNMRGFSKPRMWAQYGDGHRGVCLVINKERLEQELKRTCLPKAIDVYGGLVSYVDKSVHDAPFGGPFVLGADELAERGFEQYWKDHAIQYHKELYFEKKTDWKNESEFRYLALFEDESDVFVSINHALEGIVFGYCTPENEVKALKKMLHNGEEYIGLTWKNGCPWYDYGNPLYSGVPRFFAN